MGILVILDIVGSVIIGGMLLLILFRLNANATQNTFNFTGELIVQENLVTTVEVLEYDFRKIGYCEDPFKIINPANAILYADTSDITFLTDVNFDGIVDTMRYFLGDPAELSSTPNPNDRMLYRVINGVLTGVNLGVTKFKITYFRDSLTASGNTTLAEIYDLPKTTSPTGIVSMQIDIGVENTVAYNEEYRFAFWRQIRLASRNLSNR